MTLYAVWKRWQKRKYLRLVEALWIPLPEVEALGGDPWSDWIDLGPWPRNASGNRLRNIMGLEDAAYLDRFDRTNLCVGKAWSLREARERARELVEERTGGVIVMLGAKVSSAFGMSFRPFEIAKLASSTGSVTYVVLPHPSGLSRAWAEPNAVDRARYALEVGGALA